MSNLPLLHYSSPTATKIHPPTVRSNILSALRVDTAIETLNHTHFLRYVAASSGPKDVVIIVDISGSMEKNDR